MQPQTHSESITALRSAQYLLLTEFPLSLSAARGVWMSDGADGILTPCSGRARPHRHSYDPNVTDRLGGLAIRLKGEKKNPLYVYKKLFSPQTLFLR